MVEFIKNLFRRKPCDFCIEKNKVIAADQILINQLMEESKTLRALLLQSPEVKSGAKPVGGRSSWSSLRRQLEEKHAGPRFEKQWAEKNEQVEKQLQNLGVRLEKNV